MWIKKKVFCHILLDFVHFYNSNPSPAAMMNAEFVYHTDSAFFMFMRLKALFFLLFQRKVAPAWFK